jgi:hypothetical protein
MASGKVYNAGALRLQSFIYPSLDSLKLVCCYPSQQLTLPQGCCLTQFEIWIACKSRLDTQPCRPRHAGVSPQANFKNQAKVYEAQQQKIEDAKRRETAKVLPTSAL